MVQYVNECENDFHKSLKPINEEKKKRNVSVRVKNNITSIIRMLIELALVENDLRQFEKATCIDIHMGAP